MCFKFFVKKRIEKILNGLYAYLGNIVQTLSHSSRGWSPGRLIEHRRLQSFQFPFNKAKGAHETHEDVTPAQAPAKETIYLAWERY